MKKTQIRIFLKRCLGAFTLLFGLGMLILSFSLKDGSIQAGIMSVAFIGWGFVWLLPSPPPIQQSRQSSEPKAAIDEADEASAEQTPATDIHTQVAVYVLNTTINVAERVWRLGSMEGIPFLRPAILAISQNRVELGCRDDYGSYQTLSTMAFADVARVRFRKEVITPGKQLVKPALSGAFVGLLGTVLVFFQSASSAHFRPEMVLIVGPFLMALFAFLFVLGSLSRISTSNLAIVDFEDRTNGTVEFAIDDNKLQAVLELIRAKGVPIESLQRLDTRRPPDNSYDY